MAAQTLWSNKTILELEVKIYSEKNNLQTRVTVLDLPSRSFATLLGEMLNKMSSMPAGSWMVDELEMHFKQDYLAPLMYGFKVQIIGILEEIDSFYWPKLHLWKGDKKIGQGPPPPYLDKIQKSSSFFRDNVPNIQYTYYEL